MLKNVKIRSIAFVFLIISMLVIGAMKITGTVKAINTPWLTASGRYIKDPSGNIVILRGVSLIDVGVANAKRTRNAIQLTNMATDSANGWYARVVRFPVYPDAIDGTPGWNANPDAYYNNLLKPAIDNCVAKQIYCIIDWHYISDYNSSAIDTSTRNFWSYVAPKFANTPNVIFELYNEPINPDNWSTWKATAQPWVNLIRAVAPNNLILIGGPRWSQNVAEAASNPFTGGNIVYVCHIYPQHGGQSTWDSWFGNSSATVPYFITEFGWRNGGSNPTSGTTSGFGTPFMAYLDNKGVSWTAWVFDTIWDPYIFDSNWNLLIGDGYMGQTIKDKLAQHQNNNLPGGGGTVNTSKPTRTNTPPAITLTPTRTNTPTRTSTAPSGPTATRTRTPTAGGPTVTRTATPVPVTVTRTPTPGSGGSTCSPVTATITAPFTFDGAATHCWQASTLGNYINSWNTTSVSVNGTSYTNLYATVSSLPAKVNGYWYISYSSSVAWGHFEAK